MCIKEHSRRKLNRGNFVVVCVALDCFFPTSLTELNNIKIYLFFCISKKNFNVIKQEINKHMTSFKGKISCYLQKEAKLSGRIYL